MFSRRSLLLGSAAIAVASVSTATMALVVPLWMQTVNSLTTERELESAYDEATRHMSITFRQKRIEAMPQPTADDDDQVLYCKALYRKLLAIRYN